MKPEALTTALIFIAALAFVCEVTGLFYCAIRNIPFGRAFGFAVFTQVSIPATLIVVALVCERFSPSTGGLEPFAGTGFDRGLHLYYVLLIAGFIATLVAGSLGLSRILHTHRRNEQSHDA